MAMKDMTPLRSEENHSLMHQPFLTKTAILGNGEPSEDVKKVV